MDKNLHDDIDKFFLDRLKDYEEEPKRNIWFNIDKRLPQEKKIKLGYTKFLCAAAIITVCLLKPFILFDSLPTINTGKKISADNYNLRKRTSGNSYSKISDDRINIVNTKPRFYRNDIETGLGINNYSQSIAIIKPFETSEFVLSAINKSLKNYNELIIPVTDTTKQKEFLPSKVKPSVMHRSEKNSLSVIPFFSFDHISGRFFTQYDFDNDNKNKDPGREKPDVSFTIGILAKHKLSTKFSLASGISFSCSNTSIASTAVNALKDENGIYKFKLATNYGLAELSKSGITPVAGDSILVSSGMTQLHYLSVPLTLYYNFRPKKLRLGLHSGVAFNKIISDKVEAEYYVQNNHELETIDKIEGIKKTFFTLNAGVDVSYPLTSKLSISISPEIRYGINSINKGTPIKTYPINYGLGAYIHLKL